MPSTADALWLDTLQRISSRVAHELRGALNGVAVNLEVVRSRSAKPDAPASAVGSFAEAATSQLESVIAMTEALLTLARSSKGPVDIGATTRQLVMLLAPAAKADGRTLTIDGSLEGLGTTSADASSARLAIGGCLLAAAAAPRAVCTVNGSALRISGDDLHSPGDELVAAAKDAGIDIQTEPHAISISFPR